MSKQNTPILKLIKKRAEEIDKHIGMNDYQVNALTALIKSEFGVRNFTINIDLYSNPRLITIDAVDADSRPLYIKPKNPNILDAMLAFLGITGYKIKFSERPNE